MSGQAVVLSIVFGDHGVTATIGDTAASASYDDRPDQVWKAVLTATAEAIAAHPVDTVTLTCATGRLALWDLETLGSPIGLIDAVALGELAETDPHTWAHVETGRYAVGPLDSYALARMTRGVWHATSASTAELLGALPAPDEALPDVLPDGEGVGRTDPAAFLGLDVPISL
jgi:glycerol kinase